MDWAASVVHDHPGEFGIAFIVFVLFVLGSLVRLIYSKKRKERT